MKIVFIISVLFSVIFGFLSLISLILLRDNLLKNKFIFLIFMVITVLSIVVFTISRNFYRPFWA